jgi:2-polyprenyl-3-methyl-5-hydroxy-6-metoxy-1,4-benzoquinol methylase
MKAIMAITFEQVVTAFRMVLRRVPAPERAALIAAENATKRRARMMDVMSFVYGPFEEQNLANDRQMDAWLNVGEDMHRRIQDVVSTRDDDYSKFHRARFYDQLRALAAMRIKHFPTLPKINVLDIGVMTVSLMYQESVDGLELFTCDHPRRVEFIKNFGSANFYPVDLENEDIGERHPKMIGKFHAILFCEVLEHLRVKPSEILSDFRRILAPGGLIYLTTPNGIGYGAMLAIFERKSPSAVYSRKNAERERGGHIHVREHSERELLEWITEAGLKVRHRGIKEYYHPDNIWPTTFVGARSVLTFVLEAA